ncbi:MAG TPA: hypothetical protein VEK15_18460, partial [Vicinamibacteria bacterium]|nr:hypothetical protein [Vicinamibacteria bacterium]
QILEGEEKIFVGSRPSTLAKTLNRRLTGASLRCAEALQNLGYVGRCSFDFLVVDGEQIRFTECNGRWGGTSIPMSLVDRLVGRPRPPYRAQDVAHPGLVGAPFRDVLRAIESDPRFVLYNVGPLAQWGKLAVIAFGASQPEADEALTDDLPRLLGVK